MEQNTKKFLKDSIGWGVGLWFIGWVLGIVAFMAVPASLIGWIISPVGILITVWVLLKKINPPADEMGKPARQNARNAFVGYYLKIAVAWTLIAVVFDYFFLVKLFNPADGYYKLDVYFYYITTFVLPLLVGFFKTRKPKTPTI